MPARAAPPDHAASPKFSHSSPDIPYGPWRETCAALHLYTQILGKYRLARTPWVNHSWHATLYGTARGFTTSLVPDGAGSVEIQMDLLDHAVIGSATEGRTARFELAPMSIAAFHGRFIGLLRELGATPGFHGRPNEVPDPIPFAADDAERPYDAAAVTRFFQACAAIDGVLKRFRTSFLGKASPVHLIWGSFDLAVTRFSGALRRCIQAASRRCPTRWPAKPTATRCRRPVSGRAARASTTRPSTPTLIRRRLESPMPRWSPKRPASTPGSASSCSLTTLCGAQGIPKRPSWRSSKPPTGRRPTLAGGTGTAFNAPPASRVGLGPCEPRSPPPAQGDEHDHIDARGASDQA
jgi:hypothetical protein